MGGRCDTALRGILVVPLVALLFVSSSDIALVADVTVVAQIMVVAFYYYYYY